MRSKRSMRFFAATAAVFAALLPPGLALPSAAAQDCPDIEVIFARGTGAPPGLGWLGQAFVDSLRGKVDGRSVGAYGVNYPAGFNFNSSVHVGAADALARVRWMADNCPDTKLVLGGNSQGAGVIDLITVDPRPLGRYVPTPVPPEIADHVAAVAVFGNPLRDMAGGGPLPELSGTFGPRTIDLCALDDPFCSSGLNFPAHMSYVQNGMVEQATDYVAEQLRVR
ncbi:cutinase family protein [Mycolicibacterium vaccae]|uniref:cutinase family protein n=1 Tax=Mycolicibacterium vaccae TaxID=1810 RepID=UPI003CF7884C